MSNGSNTVGFVIGTPEALPAPWNSAPVDLTVEEGGGLPAAAVVRFPDPGRAFLRQTAITVGTPFTVHVKDGPGAPRRPLFTGEVTALEAEFDGSGSYTTVRALDVSHRLQRGRRVAGYPHATASDIVAQVCRAAGLPGVRVEPTLTLYPYTAQPNISDWDFLRMLALENDRELVVEDGVLHFRAPAAASGAPMGPPTSAFVLELGRNVLAVRAGASSVNQVGTVVVRGWDVAGKRAVSSRTTVRPSREQQFGLTPAQAAAPFPPAELLVADVPYRTAAEAAAVSGALAADTASALADLEVVVRGTPELRVGVPISLRGAGRPFDGHYTVTAAAHSDLRGVGYETRVTVSGRQDRTLHGLASGASAAARSPRMPSVAIGVVVDIMRLGRNSSAGYPGQSEQGWVKLTFPWLSDNPSGGGPAYVSDWVRSVQLGGVGGGGLFCPEIDDEVLVAFEQGLLERPVVLGGLYNGLDSPSPAAGDLVDAAGRVTRRTLASRNGDRLELLGTPGLGQGLRLTTGDDALTISLDRQQTRITVHSDGTVAVSATGGVTVHSDAALTVSAVEAVTVQGNGITLDAGAGALSLSGATVSIHGDTCVGVDAPLIKLN
ncbi:VgrG-related protein [Kitasatospora sp. NPDC088346]|uniref:VgrG-related protein n=1 Tax=Kitasatospora sp. NPDC088346 TaxID=3364073 RepID=UPI00381FD5BE